MDQAEFASRFRMLTGFDPTPWQSRLFSEFFARGFAPAGIDVPTGLGKTAVAGLWLIAVQDGQPLPRRLVYVVDRRAVVDQATAFVEAMCDRLPASERPAVSTLRGRFLDNREWLADPARPAIIVGTVDMIGSRLLFEGYGVSRRMRPYHAGLLGVDALIVLDEAHLVPPFERLLEDIENDAAGLSAADSPGRALIPPLRLLSLSATGRERQGPVFRLSDADLGEPESVTRRRLAASKQLVIEPGEMKERPVQLANAAWQLADEGAAPVRCLVFCDSRDDAEKVCTELAKRIKQRPKDDTNLLPAEPPELFIGARRLYERETAAAQLAELGFLAGADTGEPRLRFLVATSAAEVGVDLDADHMACDLVPLDRMIQRLGRVNRRGEGAARVRVLDFGPLHLPKGADKDEIERGETRHRTLKALLGELPEHDGGHDASPGALMNLKSVGGAERAQAIAFASSPVPSRPAITRALLDAWSMTGLREHTGRPEVAPWLRGWVEDQPRTSVVWRAHLPLESRHEAGQRLSLTAMSEFFSAAPIHLREQLETETYRVEKWVIERAKNLLKRAEGQATKQKITNEESGNFLVPGQIVALILNGAGDCTATLTLSQLTNLKERRSGVTLANQTLVIHCDFAGLSAAGTLDHKWGDPPVWVADDRAANNDDDSAEDAPTIPWRVVPWSGEPPPAPGAYWHLRHQFALKRNADGEISDGLAVFEWRDSALTEHSRSLAAREQGLTEHQIWAAERAHAIATALGLPDRWIRVLTLAARLHDEGKQVERWQRAFNAPHEGGPYAKTRGPINQQLLDGYRHELGSLFFAEQDAEFRSLPAEDQDLVLHLIAAHHGNARPLIETRGCDLAPPSRLETRQRDVARRFAALQRRWGPWGLAWWEALVRAADQQASKDNEQRGS